METIKNLTDLQQNLVKELINEFNKINPPKTNGTKRFNLDTINNCIKEEERFKETIAKHNITMMNVYIEQLKNDIKEFKKEFGKLFNVSMGYISGNNEFYTLNKMVEATNRSPLNNNYSSELNLYFISKVKQYSDDKRYDYFDNKKYCEVHVDFKRDKVSVTLESGKVVSVYKIVGLEYNSNSWLHRSNGNNEKFSTLDEFIQSHKPTQRKLVEMSSN